ncbi:hypothetical protein M947_02020 [Sulfurimonas hongkongensis]|uniref:Metallo-beta-lactamase domain-containing protein n=1 Tax=Sulfurimonas hongkongensis TaxID=1172190 RepID=T0JHL5_9BACT|nr:MBL fold metallo-hydrolase [Sulfurimonas hongkongensis]EQB40605.1 hypothetical protein M947_02020 [Sulfurimonas hongkongensis]
MKSLLFVALAFHSLFSFEYTLVPKKIETKIYCFFGKPQIMDTHNNGDISNSCFVDLGKSYLVIDSGPSYKYARDAHKAMKAIKNQKVSFVINTHIHDDHWLGNGYYKENGATIIGAKIFANTPKATPIRMQRFISKEAFLKTKEVFPTEHIEGVKTLDLEGVKVELTSFDKTIHTDNDMIVFIPSKSVVFAGDLVFNERVLSLRDGNINNWINVLDEIEAKNSKFIIGGHGSLYLKDSTEMTKRYLKAIKEFVLESIDKGQDITDTLANSRMSEFEHLKLYKEMHTKNIETAYRTLEWGDE